MLRHISTPTPITVARRMANHDWLELGHMISCCQGARAKYCDWHLPPKPQIPARAFWAGRSPSPTIREAYSSMGQGVGGAGQNPRPDVHTQGKSKMGWEQGGSEPCEQSPISGMHRDPHPRLCPRRRGCSDTPVQSLCCRPGCPGTPGLPSLPPKHTLQTSAQGCWGSPSWSFLLLTGTSLPFYYPQRTSGNTLGSVWPSQ